MMRDGRASVANPVTATFSDSSDSSGDEVGITDMESKRIR